MVIRCQTGVGAVLLRQTASSSDSVGTPQPQVPFAAPQQAIGAVGHDHLAGGAEGHGGLFHRIEDFLAHLDLGPEPASQRQFLRDVLEQEGKRPVGVWPTGDAIGLAIGQGPGLLVAVVVGGGLDSLDLGAPGGVVLGLGDHPRLAQAVEEGADVWARDQEIRR